MSRCRIQIHPDPFCTKRKHVEGDPKSRPTDSPFRATSQRLWPCSKLYPALCPALHGKTSQVLTPCRPELNAQNGEGDKDALRLPRAVQALYLQPLRRTPTYGVPTCDLQLRSYSIPNLEFFCDFALRAAYYLGLPAFGPVPLPKITERWTVPKSHFIFKKSQENFERITRRRLLQIRDGHPETVQIWLAFLQKHAYYGIGMKANVWEYSKMGKCLTIGHFKRGSRTNNSQTWPRKWRLMPSLCKSLSSPRWQRISDGIRSRAQCKRFRSCWRARGSGTNSTKRSLSPHIKMYHCRMCIKIVPAVPYRIIPRFGITTTTKILQANLHYLIKILRSVQGGIEAREVRRR